MVIVTQYGVRITDRVQIVSDPAAGEYIVKFDGEEIGRAHSGPHGIRIAQDWLKARRERQEAEAREALAEEARRQIDEDACFISRLADRLGIPEDDIDELLAIGRRRAQEAQP
jgi:hypothetical protein